MGQYAMATVGNMIILWIFPCLELFLKEERPLKNGQKKVKATKQYKAYLQRVEDERKQSEHQETLRKLRTEEDEKKKLKKLLEKYGETIVKNNLI